MSIRFYPAQTEEGLTYARMLTLELSEAGLPVLPADGEEEILLAVLDTDHPAARELFAALKDSGIPCLLYGTQPRVPEASACAGYFVRPFSTEVFVKRCEECLAGEGHLPVGRTSPLSLGSRPKDASFRGEPLGLTGKEYHVLTCLWENRGETVSRETLFRAAWGETDTRGSNVVDVCMRNLRRKLDERFGLRIITAVRGQGYRLTLQEGES